CVRNSPFATNGQASPTALPTICGNPPAHDVQRDVTEKPGSTRRVPDAPPGREVDRDKQATDGSGHASGLVGSCTSEGLVVGHPGGERSPTLPPMDPVPAARGQAVELAPALATGRSSGLRSRETRSARQGACRAT